MTTEAASFELSTATPFHGQKEWFPHTTSFWLHSLDGLPEVRDLGQRCVQV